MNPLSSRYYFYKNKWNLLPIVIVLSVQIGIIIFIISIGLTLLKGVAFCGYLEREHLVYVDKSDQITEEEQQSIYEEIKTYKNTQGVLEGSIGYMSTKLIFFNVEAGVLLGLKPQAIEEAMEHLGMQLMEGRLPVNQSEIIITEQGLRAAKAKIGDTLGEGNLLELERDYTIVGTIDAPMSIAISGQDVPSNAWIVFTDKEKIEETVHYFSKYSRGLKSMCNYFAYNIFDKAIHYLINTLGAVFLGTFSLGVWVTIHHLIYTDLVASEKELGLLKALGYSVRYIRQRVLKFFSVGLMAGALLGIGIGEVLIILFAYLYCYEEGITYVLWHFSFLVIPLIVLLGLYLIIFISITNYIKNIESIKTN